MYSPSMEVQVKVRSSNGKPVEGKRNTWVRDGQEFWNIRCPKGAMSEPTWRDYELNWSLSEHAEAVGMTGWDWENRCSRWVCFDFDAITGHAPGIGVSDDQLMAIREAAWDVPYVQVRKSTRGGGFHFYVFFSVFSYGQWIDDGIPCENHTLHAALARTVLAKLSMEANFNFAGAIDACGGNMWVWHRDACLHNEGLALIKDNTSILTQDDLPPNWRDHVDVVTRKRAKIKLAGVPDSQAEEFDALASGRNNVALDDNHNLLIQRIHELGYTAVWVPEFNLLQTHTCGFKDVFERYREEYSGFYETSSEASDPGEANCFAFPLSNGGWKVTRFSKGVREHETWDQDGTNWTSCYFNTRPDLESASLALGGSEISGGKGFHFDNLKKARDVVQALGGYIDLPDTWDNRECQLDKNKSNGRLIVRVKKVPEEAKPQNGWIEKGKWWEKVFKITTDSSEVTMNEYPEFDSYVRALVTPGGEHAGWAVKRTDKDTWDIQPLVNVKLVLQGAPYNVSKAEADVILGGTINRRWDLVTLPFKPEFPGNRQWNFKAPQYAFQPSDLDSDAIPYHPHWDKILDHVGRDLDESLCTDAWALRHGIMTGRQYLQLWIASMLREPFDPLPYLFLWGPENSGKSILHEAIGRLMTGGVASADRALTTSSEFNGELANAVLGVIEETDVSKAGERARNRMKDWVTSENIAIRRMRTDAYLQRNTLHFIQCSNSSDACLVTHGDTRTVVLYVPEIEAEIPKEVLKRNIEDEASDFMYTLMNLDIPPSEGRLRIPPVSTGSKEDMEQSTMSALDLFLLEHTYHVNGCTIKYSEFVERFLGQLPIEEIGLWNNRSVSRKLPRKYPTGKYGGDGATHIGNISWTPGSHGDELVSFRGRLKYRGV